MPDKYCVAIFGGAVAGSEAVEQMTKNGVHVVVFDQNALPYGKIESGLPKWHVKLRDRQEQKIDEKLDNPLVTYIPECKLGEDISFREISDQWGFNAILLATGAWKDRPLPLKNIDDFLGKGFYYQNPFVQWFNHNHDPAYKGPQFKVADNAIIIGGGLASIDVAKILMIETFREALVKKGIRLDSITIERLGLKAAAEKVNISLDDLGLQGCIIYYRRRIIDMPLSPDAESDDPASREKVHSVRQKIVSLASEKFLFKIVDCHSPKEIIVENGLLTGLVFQKNKIENDRAVPIENSEVKVITPLIISSIGSIPEQIPGVQSKGEKFELEDDHSGKLKGFDSVFALGNAITGKGNIKESQYHGRKVSESIIKDYLGVAQNEHESDYDFETDIAEQIKPVQDFIKGSNPVSTEKFDSIMENVRKLHKKSGYTGNYTEWIKNNLPVRLENLD